MERHGYRRSDNQHTGQAIGLIRDVARIYEGTLDAPPGGYVACRRHGRTHHSRPAPRHRLGRRGQDPAGRPGRSRRIQAGPSRDVRRLRRPVLHHLPVAPAGRRRLRPDGRPDEPSRRGLRRPAARPRPPGPRPGEPHAAAEPRPDSEPAPNSPHPVPHRPDAAGEDMTQPGQQPPPCARRPDPRLRGRRQRQRLGQGTLPGRRSQPVGRPAHRSRPPPRPRARPGSRTMTPTRK